MSDLEHSDGWRQREREQLQAFLKLSYRPRLDWLWQAKLFAERARLSAEARHVERRELGVEGESPAAERKEPSGT
jgi:hypothetical protein